MIEANEFELKKSSFKIESLLNLALTQIMLQVNRKGLMLTVEKDPKLPEVICTDESRLEAILLNLLISAVKYTNEGTITIKMFKDKQQTDSICFQVSDTGIGMSHEKLLEVFDTIDEAENKSFLMEQKASKSIF